MFFCIECVCVCELLFEKKLRLENQYCDDFWFLFHGESQPKCPFFTFSLSSWSLTSYLSKWRASGTYGRAGHRVPHTPCTRRLRRRSARRARSFPLGRVASWGSSVGPDRKNSSLSRTLGTYSGRQRRTLGGGGWASCRRESCRASWCPCMWEHTSMCHLEATLCVAFCVPCWFFVTFDGFFLSII